ncbi:unnamed protein product [Orchesella dallaii]|uniref:Uncharacterized protein n=1 Tax=Orchesella dallaii TaxID=48710 RepID=A0ABP1PXR0_9HEXA
MQRYGQAKNASPPPIAILNAAGPTLQKIFSHVEESFNEYYEPESEFGYSKEEELPWILQTITYFWNSIHSFAIMYVIYRSHYVNGAALAGTTQMIKAANAAKNHTCKLPTDVYAMLWIILIVSVVSLTSAIVMKIVTFCQKQWNETIDLRAAKRNIANINLE